MAGFPASVRALPLNPTVVSRPLDVAGLQVDVRALAPHSPIRIHSVAATPEPPRAQGQRFFLTAATPEQIEEANPFKEGFADGTDALPWSPTGSPSQQAAAIDAARAFYLLLMPPLRDVLERGLDLPFPLYPYQAEGVSFLAERRHALLADDMGLGKTVQTIVAARVLLGAGFIRRVLIVCPAGLKSNWRSEFDTWAPEIATQVVQGTTSQRQMQWHSPAHVFIANYEAVRNDLALMPEGPFDLVVLDEAQRIKNSETHTSRVIKAIPRRAAWCLTGTPIENSLRDLSSIAQFLSPDLAIHEDVSPEDARARIAPYLLRREKTAVLKDLPPKRIHTARLELTEAQRASYLAAEEEGEVYLRGLGETVTLQHVLALLTRLKQICNFDPETGESAKYDYLRDSLDVIVERQEKALIFSQYTQTLELLAERLADYEPLIYHGGLSRKHKDEIVRQFKSESSPPLLLISLQAGGVGLNLQEASYVYHFDRWWNPAIERQAEDRAYRIGQSRPVLVTRLVMQGTIEERIHQVLEEKEELFRRFMDGETTEPKRPGLTDAEYFGLVGLDPILTGAHRASS